MEKLYSVKSVGKDAYIGWTLDLLPDNKREKFEKYCETEEQELRLARDDKQLKNLKGTPLGMRLREWATSLELGRNEISDKLKKGELSIPPRGVKTEYKMHIPSDDTVVINERQYGQLKMYEYRAIPQTLKPGQVKATNSYEGFLEFKELTEDQAAKYLKK
jgi:hypothetical protein